MIAITDWSKQDMRMAGAMAPLVGKLDCATDFA